MIAIAILSYYGIDVNDLANILYATLLSSMRSLSAGARWNYRDRYRTSEIWNLGSRIFLNPIPDLVGLVVSADERLLTSYMNKFEMIDT